MIDEKRFSRELCDEYLEAHPKLKEDDSLLGKFVKITSDVVAAAITKYDRENPR